MTCDWIMFSPSNLAKVICWKGQGVFWTRLKALWRFPERWNPESSFPEKRYSVNRRSASLSTCVTIIHFVSDGFAANLQMCIWLKRHFRSKLAPGTSRIIGNLNSSYFFATFLAVDTDKLVRFILAKDNLAEVNVEICTHQLIESPYSKKWASAKPMIA